MPEKNNWEQFFDSHAPIYNENIFTKNTMQEVEFLIEVLNLEPGCSVLDLGCGTGRHTVELAKRGIRMTGLDLSAAMLAEGKKAADEAGVEVNWVQANAADFSLPEPFDAVVGLCEGGCGLLGLGDDPIEQPLKILGNVARCLKPEAKALFTVLSVARHHRMYQNKDVEEGRFDPLTSVETSEMAAREGEDPVPTRERSFVPTELVLLFRLAGMKVLHLWGGTAGNWGKRTLDLDEYEIMVIAGKDPESQ